MISEFFDRQGNAVTMDEWAALRVNKRVAETTLPDGKWVSTVWMGLDHSFGSGPPLIFETMVFSSKEDMSEEDCDRYHTEAEALAGHEAMVTKWSAIGASRE